MTTTTTISARYALETLHRNSLEQIAKFLESTIKHSGDGLSDHEARSFADAASTLRELLRLQHEAKVGVSVSRSVITGDLIVMLNGEEIGVVVKGRNPETFFPYTKSVMLCRARATEAEAVEAIFDWFIDRG